MKGLSVALTIGLFIFAHGLKGRLQQAGLMPAVPHGVEHAAPKPEHPAQFHASITTSNTQFWH